MALGSRFGKGHALSFAILATVGRVPATPSAFPAPPAGDPRARLSALQIRGRRSRMLPREAAVRCDHISRE